MKFTAIRENHLYQKTYAKGKRCVTHSVAVFILRDYRADKYRKMNPDKEKINRIGLAAGKKIGGAVERNRAKRIIREAYRSIGKKYTVKRGYLVVLAVREEATKLKTPDVEKDLLYALRKLEMIAT